LVSVLIDYIEVRSERASMTMRSFLHGLGLALMMGRLVVLWPFCGLSSRFHRNRPESSFVGLSL